MPASWLSWEPSEGDSEPFPSTHTAPLARDDSGAEPRGSLAGRGVVATLCRIGRALSRPAEYARFMLTASEEVAVLLQADAAFVALLDGDGALRIGPGFGFLSSEEGELLPVQGGFAGYAMHSGQVQRTRDIAADVRTARGRELGWDGCPALVAPLQSAERTLGCIVALRRAGGAEFGPGDPHRLQPVAEMLGSAFETIGRFGEARGGRAHLESERREAELALWRERYECAARATGAVVFEWDLGRNTVLWGASYADVFGADTELGLYPLEQWLEHVHPDEHERARAELLAAAGGEAPLRLEVNVVHGDGDWRLVRLRECERVPGLDGTRLIGVAEDLTDRNRLVVEREQRARTDATTQVVRGLRHEINNPLAVVLGQAQLLRREKSVKGDPLLAPAIDAIYEESLRIQTLVQRLGSLEGAALLEPILGPRGGLNIPGHAAASTEDAS